MANESVTLNTTNYIEIDNILDKNVTLQNRGADIIRIVVETTLPTDDFQNYFVVLPNEYCYYKLTGSDKVYGLSQSQNAKVVLLKAS